MFRLNQLLQDDAGQDMVEYGLLSALVSIVALATLKAISPIVMMFYNLKHHIGRGGA